MSAHTTTGDWKKGLAMASITLACWATLPVALKFAVGRVDAYTLTWFRFLVAFVITAGWQLPKHGIRPWVGLRGRPALLLSLASVMLVANYIGYILGLDRTTPGNAQVLIQLAPVLMTIGGMVIFGERYSKKQWAGFVALLIGLTLFSFDRMEGLGDTNYLVGSGLIVLASIAWAAYALAQKALLRSLTSQQVLVTVYFTGSVALFPLSEPSALLHLDSVTAVAVAYCALNTLGAYSAFTESLRHWEASRISAVLAITPLTTLATVAIAHQLSPQLFESEEMAWLAWFGALLAVAGSALSSLARGPATQKR